MTKQEALDILIELERSCLEAEANARRRDSFDFATNMHGRAAAYMKAITIVGQIEQGEQQCIRK